jgi:hypothetical protein
MVTTHSLRKPTLLVSGKINANQAHNRHHSRLLQTISFHSIPALGAIKTSPAPAAARPRAASLLGLGAAEPGVLFSQGLDRGGPAGSVKLEGVLQVGPAFGAGSAMGFTDTTGVPLASGSLVPVLVMPGI